MKIKPFYLLGTAQYNALSKSFRPHVEAWAADWFSFPSTLKLDIGDISQSFEDVQCCKGVRCLDGGRANWAVFAFDDIEVQRIAGLLMSGPDEISEQNSPTDIVSGLVRSAILDLITHLLPPVEGGYVIEEEGTVEHCMPAEAFKPGAKALQLRVDINDAPLIIWMPILPFSNCINSLTPDSQSSHDQLVERRNALGSQRINLKVYLGSADLTLGAISKLKIGDVIRLDKDLEDHLFLTLDNSPVKFSGYLGKREKCFAFQVNGVLD